jgi:hypothetical protein
MESLFAVVGLSVVVFVSTNIDAESIADKSETKNWCKLE